MLLDEDPDLGGDLAGSDFSAARGQALAPVVELEPPVWDPTDISGQADGGWLGLLMLSGLLIRRVHVGKRSACELFGPGDLFRPWDTDGEYDPLPIKVDWLVLQESRLAILDTEFVLRVARWPTINSRIVSRVAQRARNLALTQAVTHLPRADARLLILFWLLADRWGRVGPDGILIHLPLTHEVLAMLIGAHRPTATVALKRLADLGFLVREATDRWLFTRRAVETLEHPNSIGLVDDEAAGEPD